MSRGMHLKLLFVHLRQPYINFLPLFMPIEGTLENSTLRTGLIKDIIVTKSGDILLASDEKTIKVWDRKTGKEKRKILGQIEVYILGIA